MIIHELIQMTQLQLIDFKLGSELSIRTKTKQVWVFLAGIDSYIQFMMNKIGWRR